MKKITKILALSFICLMLVACGGKPEGMSDDAYETGIDILEITEKYLGAELEEKAAYDKVMFLNNQIDTGNMDYNKNVDVSLCAYDIMKGIDKGKTDDVKVAQKELKSLLNK